MAIVVYLKCESHSSTVAKVWVRTDKIKAVVRYD